MKGQMPGEGDALIGRTDRTLGSARSMTSRPSSLRGLAVAAVLGLSAAGLGGCGGVDGIEFNGKIFDAIGLSGDGLGKKPEVKTEARAPLVLPPDPERLPDPNTVPQPSAANEAWPKDPQQRKMAETDARKRAQQQYCRDGNWKEKAMRDDTKADSGPDGSCTGSIFSVLGNTLFGNE